MYEISGYHVLLAVLGSAIVLSHWLPRWVSGREPAASALLAMTTLIAVRIVRQWRATNRQALKAALTRELLRAAEGKETLLVERRSSRREQAILVGAGIELLDLVRGDIDAGARFRVGVGVVVAQRQPQMPAHIGQLRAAQLPRPAR